MTEVDLIFERRLLRKLGFEKQALSYELLTRAADKAAVKARSGKVKDVLQYLNLAAASVDASGRKLEDKLLKLVDLDLVIIKKLPKN
jgi:hypothetical protein